MSGNNGTVNSLLGDRYLDHQPCVLWLNVVSQQHCHHCDRGVFTIKSSNRVARAAEKQAEETTKSVEASTAQVELERKVSVNIRPTVVVDVTFGDITVYEVPRPSLEEDPELGVVLVVPVRNVGSGSAFCP